jgi:hypothetical protein
VVQLDILRADRDVYAAKIDGKDGKSVIMKVRACLCRQRVVVGIAHGVVATLRHYRLPELKLIWHT